MFKRVYYIVKSNMHYYPPCMSQIKMLQDQGAEVVAVYGSSNQVAIDELNQRSIETVELVDPRGKYKGFLDKANNWICFRMSLKKFLKTVDAENSLIWFGNAETALPMLGLIENRYHYVITYLELLDTHPKRVRLMKNMAQRAEAIVTCEETRSYLMQHWFGLEKLPYTMPNKPYDIRIPKQAEVTSENGKYVMNQVNSCKFMVYQGIFQDYDYLATVAKVLNDCYPEIYLVMMGIDRSGVADRIKTIYKNVVNVDYIPAPLHLEVTSNAYLGLLFYHPDSLNKAFCAPNKIFEYSNFSLPILANNIPGLSNTIGKAGAGVCVDFTYENVRAAISEMINNYDIFAKRSRLFFESVDNMLTMKALIESVGVKTGETED